MADATEGAVRGGKSFLTTKVGPLPLGIWLAAGIGLYLYFQHSAKAGGGPQTDPAGNVGTIDPATGYVYGTPEDKSALSGVGGGGNVTGSDTTGNAGQQSTTGGQAYADNNSWGIAAVNYLVGLGIDATTANQAIQLYLSSQPLTTAQQGDVNLAIQRLGPPPTLPGPISSNPPPVTTPPGTTPPPGTKPPGTKPPGTKPPAKTAPPPTGLVVSAKSNHSLRVKWNRAAGATGYHVLCTDMHTKAIKSEHDLAAATLTAVFTGLDAAHSYVVDVWSLPRASGNAAHASVSATLPK